MLTGVCLFTGGVPGPGRVMPSPGGGMLPRGVPPPEGVSAFGGCLVETPLTATSAGGTHPTGMHSCLLWMCKMH